MFFLCLEETLFNVLFSLWLSHDRLIFVDLTWSSSFVHKETDNCTCLTWKHVFPPQFRCRNTRQRDVKDYDLMFWTAQIKIWNSRKGSCASPPQLERSAKSFSENLTGLRPRCCYMKHVEAGQSVFTVLAKFWDLTLGKMKRKNGLFCMLHSFPFTWYKC